MPLSCGLQHSQYVVLTCITQASSILNMQSSAHTANEIVSIMNDACTKGSNTHETIKLGYNVLDHATWGLRTLLEK